jgi:hypothetical protein
MLVRDLVDFGQRPTMGVLYELVLLFLVLLVRVLDCPQKGPLFIRRVLVRRGDFPNPVQSRLEIRLRILDLTQPFRLGVEKVKERVKSQLAHLNFELLDRLHARDVFFQDFGKVRLQPVNVPNAEQASRKKKDAEYDGWNRDAQEQFSFHGATPNGFIANGETRRSAVFKERRPLAQ